MLLLVTCFTVLIVTFYFNSAELVGMGKALLVLMSMEVAATGHFIFREPAVA